MKARIYFIKNDFEDSIELEGSLEEIQQQAELIVQQRRPDEYWSEVIAE